MKIGWLPIEQLVTLTVTVTSTPCCVNAAEPPGEPRNVAVAVTSTAPPPSALAGSCAVDTAASGAPPAAPARFPVPPAPAASPAAPRFEPPTSALPLPPVVAVADPAAPLVDVLAT